MLKGVAELSSLDSDYSKNVKSRSREKIVTIKYALGQVELKNVIMKKLLRVENSKNFRNIKVP